MTDVSRAASTRDAGQPLAGRTLLITGGSRGIGRATVIAAHAQGARVVLHHATGVDEARSLADRLGSRVHLVRGDLTLAAELDRVWDSAVDWAGHVDVLVNNAGAWIASPLDDATAWDEGWAANLAINLIAPAELCRRAIPHFRAHGGGIVVNVVSRSSHRGDDVDHLAYGAAKGGLLALTKGIARGLAGEGVLAYAVAPGWVATGLATASLAGVDLDPREFPLGEVTPPEEVAELIAFLASGRVRHATGATIDVTGASYVR